MLVITKGDIQAFIGATDAFIPSILIFICSGYLDGRHPIYTNGW